MTPRQRHRIDLLEKKGYSFDVAPIRYGHGALLITSWGHWIPEVQLVLNTDGSYHAALES